MWSLTKIALRSADYKIHVTSSLRMGSIGQELKRKFKEAESGINLLGDLGEVFLYG